MFLFQWHPTKFIFEWSTEMDYVHTQTNVQSGQYFANLFVNQGGFTSVVVQGAIAPITITD